MHRFLVLSSISLFTDESGAGFPDKHLLQISCLLAREVIHTYEGAC
jgi:hypothetical protein